MLSMSIGINSIGLRHRSAALFILLLGLLAFLFSSLDIDRMVRVTSKKAPGRHYCSMCHKMMLDGEPCCKGCNTGPSSTPIFSAVCDQENSNVIRAATHDGTAIPLAFAHRSIALVPRVDEYPTMNESGVSHSSTPVSPPPRAGRPFSVPSVRWMPAQQEA